jgi:CO/xanthine dehydrogenase Mo-binding subunit
MPFTQSTNIIGKPIPLIDGLKKTTGEGIYTDDLKLPGCSSAKFCGVRCRTRAS